MGRRRIQKSFCRSAGLTCWHGLTKVDMALSLDRQGHRGKITALSPRGLLSQVHRNVKPIVVAAKDVPFGAELSKLSSWVRQLCTNVVNQGGDWRSAID